MSKTRNKIRGIFVAGTGTAVGKTLYSVLLITHLKKRLGLEVAAMKPAETGCSPRPGDALALLAATGRSDPIERVCPYALALPAAPEAAAAAAGIKIDLNVIRRCFNTLARQSDMVIVEGAGGLATPYAPRLTGIDIARRLNLGVILVTPESLGTISQTITAVRALAGAAVPCLGVVLSITSAGRPQPHHASNAALIATHIRPVPFLGTLPHLTKNPDRLDPSLVPSLDGILSARLVRETGL